MLIEAQEVDFWVSEDGPEDKDTELDLAEDLACYHHQTKDGQVYHESGEYVNRVWGKSPKCSTCQNQTPEKKT